MLRAILILVFLVLMVLPYGMRYLRRYLRKRRAQRGGGSPAAETSVSAKAESAVTAPGPTTSMADEQEQLRRIVSRSNLRAQRHVETEEATEPIQRVVSDQPLRKDEALAAAGSTPGSAPRGRAVDRLGRLSPLKRAIVWSEILGRPKGDE